MIAFEIQKQNTNYFGLYLKYIHCTFTVLRKKCLFSSVERKSYVLYSHRHFILSEKYYSPSENQKSELFYQCSAQKNSSNQTDNQYVEITIKG